MADALRARAREGATILACEAGPFYRHEAFNQREWDMSALYWDRGATPNQDYSLTVARGKSVGGSTTVYTGVTFRMPPQSFDRWRSHGIPWSYEDLQAEYQALEEEISAHELPDAMVNENNWIFQRGCTERGLPVEKIKLNIKDCKECGFCNLGCRYGAMQNAMTVYWPKALADGVQLLAHCELKKLEPHRAYFLLSKEGLFQNRFVPAGKLCVEARVIVLSCGAMATPRILLKTPFLPKLSGLGRGLQTHPATMIFGLAPQKISNTRGFPKTFFTDAFVSEGVLLETAFYFPFVTARLLPGIGRRHFALMQKYHQMACILCLTHGPKREGNGFIQRGKQFRFHFCVEKETQKKLCRGVQESAKIFFAGGCEAAMSSLIDEGVLSSWQAGDVEKKIEPEIFQKKFLSVSSAHPQGGCALGTGEDAVCELSGQVRGVPHLYVADASLFPECTVVNPHLTVMLLGRRVGKAIAERL